jgi:hypothetical protein
MISRQWQEYRYEPIMHRQAVNSNLPDRQQQKDPPYTVESRSGLTVSANERIQIAHCVLPCTALSCYAQHNRGIIAQYWQPKS